jgi:hypothetical protein
MIGKVEGALSSRRKRAELMLAQEPGFENTKFCNFVVAGKKRPGAGPPVEKAVHILSISCDLSS